jgi:erythronate-4-phosphate dehydrogenase
MILAIDRAIPYWAEAFSEIGELRPFSAEKLKPKDIRDIDALVVRSVTQVDASLMEGSSTRFVAAASAGFDHINRKYLRTRGIGFGYAAGCNAVAVSEYIAAALVLIASRRNWDLCQKSIAVIGVGHVGSRVAIKAHALGMKVLLCDPPLRELTGDSKYQDFEDVLGADILSFHVPLVSEGPYATMHMVNRTILDRLSPNQYLINSARGAVIDNSELKTALGKGRIEGAVLDVWEGEPQVDFSLLDLVDIGTPHIAGTAIDGKIRATEMAREELCSFFKIQTGWNTEALYPKETLIDSLGQSAGQDAVLSMLLQAFDISGFDSDLRRSRTAADFIQMRINHPLRPEFRHFRIDLRHQDGKLQDIFTGLGFQVVERGE